MALTPRTPNINEIQFDNEDLLWGLSAISEFMGIKSERALAMLSRAQIPNKHIFDPNADPPIDFWISSRSLLKDWLIQQENNLSPVFFDNITENSIVRPQVKR